MYNKTDTNINVNINPSSLIILAGPTACGKTETAVELAKIINGEIISADSMQIYKYMDIGTAKPTKSEMQGIKHYLIDELYPDEEYSVASFQKMAGEYIDSIRQKGKIPIVAGGTGFYINAILKDNDFTETSIDTNFRDSLYRFAEANGNTALHSKLRQVDPEAAEAIHENNVKRVIRALEYYEQTGEKISLHNKNEKNKPYKEKSVIIVLNMERAALYDRINKRAEQMLQNGLVNEVFSLLEMGYNENLISMQGLGYKEIVPYIKGKCTLDVALDEIKKGTRHFAKRQFTWFSRQCQGIWLDANNFSKKTDIAEYIYNHIINEKINLNLNPNPNA